MLSIGWLWHYESKEINHFKELANFASISDYSIFVKNMPADWKIESYDNKVISNASTVLEKRVATFFTAQVKEQVKHSYAEDVAKYGLGKTLKDNMIVDSTGEVVSSVTLCLDEGEDIAFYKDRKPLKRDFQRTEWHIKKLNADIEKLNAEDEKKIIQLTKKIGQRKIAP